MKIKNPSRKPSKKAFLLAISGSVAILLGYTVFAFQTNSWPFRPSQNINITSSTTEDVINNNTPPNSGFATDKTDDESVTPKTPAENAPTPEPAPGTVGVTVTSIHDDNDTLKIRTLIETISNNGTCTLTFKQAETTITKTSDIQALPSSSTCKGFSIPTSELSPGSWNVTLSVKAENKTGSVSRTYEVRQ